jgi:hypothetical protein
MRDIEQRPDDMFDQDDGQTVTLQRGLSPPRFQWASIPP